MSGIMGMPPLPGDGPPGGRDGPSRPVKRSKWEPVDDGWWWIVVGTVLVLGACAFIGAFIGALLWAT